MYDELTAVDIQKMQEEINYRIRELRPQLIEEVQTARAFGDLSENYEYKCAKQAKNRNDSRIRYLERMIRTAKVIEVKETADAVSLFDTVTIYNEMLKKEMTVRIVIYYLNAENKTAELAPTEETVDSIGKIGVEWKQGDVRDDLAKRLPE